MYGDKLVARQSILQTTLFIFHIHGLEYIKLLLNKVLPNLSEMRCVSIIPVPKHIIHTWVSYYFSREQSLLRRILWYLYNF